MDKSFLFYENLDTWNPKKSIGFYCPRIKEKNVEGRVESRMKVILFSIINKTNEVSF